MKLSYLVLQVDMRVRTQSGQGVIKPVHCDGFYREREDAEGVAAIMRERFPALDTYVVKIVAEVA
jgi:hypothetical protein